MGALCPLARQGLIVVLTGCDRIQSEVELVPPTEFKPRLRQRIVPVLSRRMPFGQVSRMGRNLVGDHSRLHIIPVGQSQVLLRRDVAKHRTAIPTDHRRSDCGCDVIIPGGNIRSQRSERVERRLMTPLQLLLHVLLNQMHRNMTRALVHYLHPALPRPLG